MTWLDFISSFGGISFVSLVKILFWFSIRLWKKLDSRWKEICYYILNWTWNVFPAIAIVSKNDDIVIVLRLPLVLSAELKVTTKWCCPFLHIVLRGVKCLIYKLHGDAWHAWDVHSRMNSIWWCGSKCRFLFPVCYEAISHSSPPTQPNPGTAL